MFRRFIFLTTFLLLSSSCSEDNSDVIPNCFQEEGRRVVGTITEAFGTIKGPMDGCPIFTIQLDKENAISNLGTFFACNLDQEFQIAGSKVIFSGLVYESFETEDICADFFEITEISFISGR